MANTIVQGFLEEFFEDAKTIKHYGVKGMKWGQRKARSSSSGGMTRAERKAEKKRLASEPQDVVVRTQPGKRVQTNGGKNQPAHTDAIKAATLKRKAKSSTTDSLSDEELSALLRRMDLEQRYAKMTARKQSGVEKFTRELFRDAAKKEASTVLREGISDLKDLKD